MVAKFVLLSTKLTSRKVQYFGQFVIESLGRLNSWLWITLQWWKSYLYPICIKIWEAMKFYIKRNRYALKVQKGKKKYRRCFSFIFQNKKKINRWFVCKELCSFPIHFVHYWFLLSYFLYTTSCMLKLGA